MENQKFIPGNLVVVAGRPAMGKTQFLCSFASKRNAEHQVLYYSLELSEQQIIKRVDTELKIVDTPALTLQNIIDRTRELVKEEGVHTVVIDYLQLIQDSNPESVLATLKSLAVELGIEIVVGVLVKRSYDTEVKAPTKEGIGIGGVGNIDRFIPLHRPEYYNINGIRVYIENGEQRLGVQDSFYFLF